MLRLTFLAGSVTILKDEKIMFKMDCNKKNYLVNEYGKD